MAAQENGTLGYERERHNSTEAAADEHANHLIGCCCLRRGIKRERQTSRSGGAPIEPLSIFGITLQIAALRASECGNLDPFHLPGFEATKVASFRVPLPAAG